MYIIVGANGYLGAYFIKKIRELTNDSIIATARDIRNLSDDERVKWVELDVTQKESVNKLNVFMKKDACNKVIYLAAYHHPDLVEKNPKIAWNVNITSLAYFLNYVENVDSLFYPSTDSVYGEGTIEKKFKETDKTKPVNRYGRQKVIAENLVVEYGYNVVRFPFLVAPSLVRCKKHFYDFILQDIKDGKKVEMFVDSIRSSLDFGTAAELVVKLAEKKSDKIPKILNVSGDQALSKYDVGLMIAEKNHIDTNLIIPISVKNANEIFRVPRANITLLDNSNIKKVLEIDTIKISI